jgi:hypothetical protein
MLSQLSFLTSLLSRLRDSPDTVLAAMESVQESISRVDNLRVFVATDVDALPHPKPLEPWRSFPLQQRWEGGKGREKDLKGGGKEMRGRKRREGKGGEGGRMKWEGKEREGVKGEGGRRKEEGGREEEGRGRHLAFTVDVPLFDLSPSSSTGRLLPPVLPLRELQLARPIRTRIAGVGGVDSNYLVHICPSVTSHTHPDLPAIMVFIEYLCALEVSGMSDRQTDRQTNRQTDRQTPPFSLLISLGLRLAMWTNHDTVSQGPFSLV